MAWEAEFHKFLESKTKMSPGMVSHYRRMLKDKVYHTCSECDLVIGKAHGPRHKYCPNCGVDMSNQDGFPRKELKGIKDVPVKDHEVLADGSLKERVGLWRSVEALCEEAHSKAKYQMIPWSPNGRFVCLESVDGDKVKFAVYAPYEEYSNRVVECICLPLSDLSAAKLHEEAEMALGFAISEASSLTRIPDKTLLEHYASGSAVAMVTLGGLQKEDRDADAIKKWAPGAKASSDRELLHYRKSRSKTPSPPPQPEWEKMEGQLILRIPGEPVAAIPASGKKNARNFVGFDVKSRKSLANLSKAEVRGWLLAKAKSRNEASLLATPNSSASKGDTASLPIEDVGAPNMASKHVQNKPDGKPGDVKTVKTFKPMNSMESALAEMLGGDNQGPAFSGVQKGEPVGFSAAYRDATPPPRDKGPSEDKADDEKDEATVDDFTGPSIPHWKQAKEGMVRAGLPGPGDDYGQAASVTASKKEADALRTGMQPPADDMVSSKKEADLLKMITKEDSIDEGRKADTINSHLFVGHQSQKAVAKLVKLYGKLSGEEKSAVSPFAMSRLKQWAAYYKLPLNESTATYLHHEAHNRAVTEEEGSGDIHGQTSHDNGTDGTRNYQHAIAVCIKDRKEVLIGKANTDDDRDGLWCFPGGGIDKEDGGDPVAAAIRECYEEMGVKCTSTGTVINHHDKPTCAFVVCEYVQGDLTPNSEFHDALWMPAAARHDFPGLYPTNKAVLEQVPPQMLKEAISFEDVEGVYEALFGEKIGGTKANAVGTKRSVTGGEGAPAPDRAKPGTSMKEPEKQKALNGDIKGSEKKLSDPGGDEGGEDVLKAAQDKEKEDEKAGEKENGQQDNGSGKKPPSKGKAPAPKQPASNGQTQAQPKVQAPQPKQAAAPQPPQDTPQVVAALKQAIDSLSKASQQPPGGSQTPTAGPQPQQASGGQEPQQGGNTPVAGGQAGLQPNQQVPGQQPSALQQAVNGMYNPAQQQPQPQGPSKTVQLVLQPDKAKQAAEWMQAMGLQNVTVEGGKVLVAASTAEEMAVVRRTASAFGLEMNGTTVPTQPMAGATA